MFKYSKDNEFYDLWHICGETKTHLSDKEINGSLYCMGEKYFTIYFLLQQSDTNFHWYVIVS